MSIVPWAPGPLPSAFWGLWPSSGCIPSHSLPAGSSAAKAGEEVNMVRWSPTEVIVSGAWPGIGTEKSIRARPVWASKAPVPVPTIGFEPPSPL
jgi:hypothetical protein